MNSIFFRIYGGVVLSLVLVTLLAYVTWTVANEVRAQENREKIARGTFTLVSNSLVDRTEEERERWLGLLSRLMGYKLRIVPIADTELDSTQRSRLARGDVLVDKRGPGNAYVYSRLPIDDQELALSAHIQRVTEQQARATVYLILNRLSHQPAEKREEEFANIATFFGYPIRLIAANSAPLRAEQRSRMRRGEVILELDREGNSAMIYAEMLGGAKVLQMGPLSLPDPYPFSLVVSILIAGLCGIAFAVYLLIRPLERRLRKLERVASHISRGNLEARVKETGSDAVGRLAAAFNGMAEDIQRLLSIQREMIRAVSHELRTPVARIRFGVKILEDTDDYEERIKQGEMIDKDIQELDELIDEILTYARLEEGQPTLNFEMIDVDDVVREVVDERRPSRDDVTVEQVCSSAPLKRRQAEIERRYIHRCIQNLVGNAYRYAESNIRVTYTASADTCRIDVDDDGQGIPEKDWERVFTPFARLDDSRTKATGGYGLGLSIVQRIVYWHGGRAIVGRSDLGGARFSLIWPRKQGKR